MKKIISISHTQFLIILLIIFSGCDNKQNPYEFDFEKDWTWEDLKNKTSDKDALLNIDKIKQALDVEDAQFLFYQLSELENPNEIQNLSDIQTIQDSLGGSFYGLAPEFPSKKDTIPIPDNFDNLIAAGRFLSDIRKANYDAISKSAYPLNFKNSDFIKSTNIIEQSKLKLELDYSCIKSIIKACGKNSITIDEALEISTLPGFKNMLEHRRNLGYIPEPLPTEESLAQFITYAVSKESLYMIWKWLSPWNYFNLSEISMNQDEYSRLIKIIEDNEKEIVRSISNRIIRLIPDDFEYSDTLTIAINWGIRSWATSNQLGTNIVQFKDDFDLLIRTLSHETFHRVQLQICPLDPAAKAKNTKEFEDIVTYAFPDINDSKFYETLSYIFLEGSASFVGGMDSLEMSTDKLNTGLELLHNVYNSIYIDNDLGNVDELINKGLKSNGPFYVLGYLMTKRIVKHSDSDGVKGILNEGCLGFFNRYIQIKNKSTLHPKNDFHFNKKIEEKIIQLNEIFKLLYN
jgi:hypothetical protein